MMEQRQTPEQERPFFSIITVSFNAEKVIGPTLQSVVDQKGVDGLVEQWVVDGASKDGTLDVVRQFPNVRYISEPDKGITDAFNKGMNLATGLYIIYLNCDDIFCDNNVLADLRKFAVEKNLPDWIVGDWYIRRLNGRLDYVKPKPPLAGWNLFLGPRIGHQAMALKLDVQRAIGGFDLDYKLAMDYDLWARLYQTGYQITNIGRPLAVFAAGGFSSRNDDIAKREIPRIKARLRDNPLKRAVGYLYDRTKRTYEKMEQKRNTT